MAFLTAKIAPHRHGPYAGRVYDSDPLWTWLRRLRIEPPIARRRTPHGSGLSRVRRAVEGTIRGLKALRR